LAPLLLLQLRKKTLKGDDEPIGLSSFSVIEKKQSRMMMSRDPSLSSSFAIEEKKYETTTNLPACYSLLQVRKKKLRYNDEPGSSSSSPTTQEKPTSRFFFLDYKR